MCWKLWTRGALLMSMMIALDGSASARDDKLRQKIEQIAKPYVDAKRVEAVSIGVIKAGETTTVHLGNARGDGGRPNDDTVYEIGSVSKVFTALLVTDAVARGDLRLDQPVQDLLPAGVKMPAGNDREITILDILTHRSGLPQMPNNVPMEDPNNPVADYTSKFAFEFLNGHQLRREPGAEYEYSNFAMGLLGHLVSRKYGLSYDELLKQRINRPLGMRATAVKLSPDMRRNLATPHAFEGVPASLMGFADIPGAGGVCSSMRDMLLFSQAHIDTPDDAIGKAIDLTWQKHPVIGAPQNLMGLGWHFMPNRFTRYHNGQTLGSHSMVMIGKPKKLAVVLLSNTALMELDRLAIDTMQLLRGTDVKPRIFGENKRAVIRVGGDVMRRYVGRYELADNVSLTVFLNKRNLFLKHTDQPAIQIFAKSETDWFCKMIPTKLSFRVDDAGKCSGMLLTIRGTNHTALRVDAN